MRKHFFWLQYPDPLDPRNGDQKQDRIELALEGEALPETNLNTYLKDRDLNKYRRHLHMIRLQDRIPLHWWYIPQSGDVVRCSYRDPGVT